MLEPDDSISSGNLSGTDEPQIFNLNTLRANRFRNRITTTETVTYEREDGEPFQITTKCSRPIEQDTQPYQREIKVTEEWKPIDLGWALEWDKIGTISIQHLGEKTLQRNPTPEEKLENASRSLYVALGSDSSPFLEIYPKDSFRSVVSDPRALRIRAKSGTIRCLLTIFPG